MIISVSRVVLVRLVTNGARMRGFSGVAHDVPIVMKLSFCCVWAVITAEKFDGIAFRVMLPMRLVVGQTGK